MPDISQAVPTLPAFIPGERLLDIKAVTARMTISRSKLYALISEGFFPPPLKIAPQMSRWAESAVDDWVHDRKVVAALAS